MNLTPETQELVIRYLDGRLSAEESAQLGQFLAQDAAARELLMESAELAVMVADLERTATARESWSHGPADPWTERSESARRDFTRFWQWSLAACAAALGAISYLALANQAKPPIAEVREVTGVTHYFCSTGRTEAVLQRGMSLVAGDLIESRSCDAWITLEVTRGATLTIAGHSAIRVQHSDASELRFELMEGSLWFSPTPRSLGPRVIVSTPVFDVQFHDSMLNIQTSSSESIVRVGQGSAEVTRKLDATTVETKAGFQTYVSLGDKGKLLAVPQPVPVSQWTSQQMKGTEVLLGNWLPATDNERTRLGAAPLLWPVPEHEPVMLYAIAIAAWRCSEQPVLLHADSKLRFRGRTQRPQTVRLGFSVQKMHSVFAGKFEIDVPASSLVQSGEYWEVEFPLSDFRPLHPHLASSPEGLELTDVYALTIADDAGLEITSIELSAK